MLSWKGDDDWLIFRTKRGTGFVNQRDGVCYKNVLASYTHLHALGFNLWAKILVEKAIRYKQGKKDKVVGDEEGRLSHVQ